MQTIRLIASIVLEVFIQVSVLAVQITFARTCGGRLMTEREQRRFSICCYAIALMVGVLVALHVRW